MLPDTDKKRAKPLIIKMAGYLEKKGRMVSYVLRIRIVIRYLVKYIFYRIYTQQLL